MVVVGRIAEGALSHLLAMRLVQSRTTRYRREILRVARGVSRDSPDGVAPAIGSARGPHRGVGGFDGRLGMPEVQARVFTIHANVWGVRIYDIH